MQCLHRCNLHFATHSCVQTARELAGLENVGGTQVDRHARASALQLASLVMSCVDRKQAMAAPEVSLLDIDAQAVVKGLWWQQHVEETKRAAQAAYKVCPSCCRQGHAVTQGRCWGGVWAMCGMRPGMTGRSRIDRTSTRTANALA